MPTYDTPTPIDVAIDLQVGAIRVTASDRSDTVVTVSATNPGKAVDRRGAEETEVAYSGGRLTIIGPRPRISVFGPTESVDLLIEVPSGSRLTAEVAAGAVRATGRLGATRIKASSGPVELDRTGDLWLRAGHGGVTVEAVDGSAEITADHGQIRLRTVTRDAVLKASHGTVFLGEVQGGLDAKLSYGDLELTRATGSVTARTAYGSISIGEVSAGSIDLESGYGPITVGVRTGVPAFLDLSTKNGHVRNELAGESAPRPGEQSVAVRARTQYSDIGIRPAR